jgi:triosephosphate isomerase
MSGSTIKPWVVGNWKMNPMQADAKQLLQEFKQLLQENEIAEEKCNIGLAPVTLALTSMQAELANAARSVFTVAQDVSRFGNMGAYTGEVSAELLKDSQIEYVLIGHSERREYFAESAAILNAKAQNALNAGLKVIYCVGETDKLLENVRLDLLQRQASAEHIDNLLTICFVEIQRQTRGEPLDWQHYNR